MSWLERPIASPLPLDADAGRVPDGEHAVFSAGFGGHVAGATLARR